MSLKRINGRPYYYRNVKVDGKVRSKYLGCGEVAEVIAKIEAEDRRERGLAALAWKAERDALEVEDRRRASSFQAVERIVGLALELFGYHRHKRGQWRKRRMNHERKGLPEVAGWPGTFEEINGVLKRAAAGDQDALPRLREMIRADPARMFKATGADLADQVEQSTTKKMFVGNVVTTEALHLKMKALRAELRGTDPCPIVRLLAERVALCWLDVHWCDLRHVQAEAHSLVQAAHFQKMRDRSSRRYLASLRTLASVKKIGIVAVQISIDKQQINIAGRTEPTTSVPLDADR
jgi:hypothetical protein